eukprot:CAMPEP_0182427634 /NCGR_PEP_ID=MMETSP1167-20130531/18931_1 /TAXON_ID=2988 /ORGANISM="Mallomonas Sp, Strain CCMP3275" /LENGTH=180 /DNA_ID=CAMNT_0024610007 /DNA_START=33 /DNA_END=575 /DNA_ORIENTATION=+
MDICGGKSYVETESDPFSNFWMEGDSLAPPCQADMNVVDSILKFAQLDSSSVLYDLGCGDGRICVEATRKFGCKCCGVEIEEKLIEEFKRSVEIFNLHENITIIHGDLLQVDFSSASVIVIYLLPEAIELLKSKLHEAIVLGAVLICNTWGPSQWSPSELLLCGDYGSVTLKKYDHTSIP